MSVRRERLGKGLEALIGEYLPEDLEPSDVRELPVDAIVPNPFQPRRDFDEEEMASLASSIRENGLLQPLVVRPTGSRLERYELIAGERRLRAVASLGWEQVPVVVKDIDDRALLVLALVENLQREALNPLEEAEGYRSLADRFGLTQEEIAAAVGKQRSTVANMVRLLRLPPSVRRLLEAEKLQMGHARALLAVEDARQAADLARRAVESGWSVREVERRVRALASPPEKERKQPAGRRSPEARTPAERAVEEGLREALGARVRLRLDAEGKGTVEIPFHGREDLERVFARITGRELHDYVS